MEVARVAEYLRVVVVVVFEAQRPRFKRVM